MVYGRCATDAGVCSRDQGTPAGESAGSTVRRLAEVGHRRHLRLDTGLVLLLDGWADDGVASARIAEGVLVWLRRTP